MHDSNLKIEYGNNKKNYEKRNLAVAFDEQFAQKITAVADTEAEIKMLKISVSTLTKAKVTLMMVKNYQRMHVVNSKRINCQNQLIIQNIHRGQSMQIKLKITITNYNMKALMHQILNDEANWQRQKRSQ